ncbi:hypothetical protein HanIR_Chr03g0132611 [Helianthus annuus]|nr:hypothetical protein HanIR_Chr03g0132611 [Helianthus annuus]
MSLDQSPSRLTPKSQNCAFLILKGRRRRPSTRRRRVLVCSPSSDGLSVWIRPKCAYGTAWDPSGTGIPPSPTAPKNPIFHFSLLALPIDP